MDSKTFKSNAWRRKTIRVFLLCMLLTPSGAMAQGANDAHAKFARLLEQIKTSRRNNDLKRVVSKSLELADLLHYSGPATEQVAMAYAELGDTGQALAWLRKFAAMGQSDDKLPGRPQFDSIKSSPGFKRILAAMRNNESPIDRGTEVVRFRDAGLLPEDLDYDPSTRSFLITSVLGKKIVRIGFDGATDDFARSPDGWPVFAIRIDTRRGIVWATEVALNQFAGVPPEDGGQSALLCYRLRSGDLVRRISVPHTSLGDMALMPNGDLIVVDNDGGAVYRVRAGCTDPHLQRVDSGQFISPQTPAAAPDGRHVFVPDYVRGIGLLDLDTKQVTWVDARRRHATQGIDGLYFVHGKLIAIQNGASPERVVSFGLNDHLQITSERIIDRSYPAPGDPTHGVAIGDDFYYLSNSGWHALDNNGRLKSGARMTPAFIEKATIAGLHQDDIDANPVNRRR